VVGKNEGKHSPKWWVNGDESHGGESKITLNKQKISNHAPPETNIAPENGWLGDYILGRPIFRGKSK